SDRDHPADLIPLHRAHHLFKAVLDLERVDAGGAEDSSASMQNSGGGLAGEPEMVVLEKPPPSITQPHDFEAIWRSTPDNGPNHGVEPRPVPPAGQYGNFHSSSSRAKAPRAQRFVKR